MPVNLGAPEDFSADEQAVLARLIAEDRANGDTDEIVDPTTLVPPPPPAPVVPPVAAAPAPVNAPAPQPANNTPAASPAPQPQGNVTAALRASRAAERAAREHAAALEAEVTRLRAAAPTPPPADNGLTEEELRELQVDYPTMGKLGAQVQKLTEQLAAARAQAPAAPPPPPAPGFVPQIQDDPDVQSAIDENPDALAWQHNPDQSAWQYLVAQENMLQSSPVWGPKPLPERLAEAARRVRAEIPSSAPTPAEVAAQAAAAAAAATTRAPNTLSDITGGGSPKTPTPGVEQFMKMSDDDIFLALERSGGG